MGYAGRALPYGDVKVMKSETEEAVPGELGEIWMRGASVTPGYWNRPDATAEAFVGDWLKSGDIGRRDETGRLSSKTGSRTCTSPEARMFTPPK